MEYTEAEIQAVVDLVIAERRRYGPDIELPAKMIVRIVLDNLPQPAKQQTTEFGCFKRDKSGLYHYVTIGWAGHILVAMDDAIRHLPHHMAAWFWQAGTPCPIHPDDNVDRLNQRYIEFRDAYQAGDAKGMLDILQLPLLDAGGTQ